MPDSTSGKVGNNWIQRNFEAFIRRIKREKIQTPGPGQHVAECHYSKTGWAIWNDDGGCTCKPAKAPTPTGDAQP